MIDQKECETLFDVVNRYRSSTCVAVGLLAAANCRTPAACKFEVTCQPTPEQTITFTRGAYTRTITFDASREPAVNLAAIAEFLDAITEDMTRADSDAEGLDS